MCRIMCEERGAVFYVPEKEYLVDNGAMIAWQGMLQHKKVQPLSKTKILPYWRTDEVNVDWI